MLKSFLRLCFSLERHSSLDVLDRINQKCLVSRNRVSSSMESSADLTLGLQLHNFEAVLKGAFANGAWMAVSSIKGRQDILPMVSLRATLAHEGGRGVQFAGMSFREGSRGHGTTDGFRRKDDGRDWSKIRGGIVIRNPRLERGGGW
jgi:hypothetical protein